MATYAPVQETLAPAAGPPIDPDVLEQRRKLAQALIAQAMGGEPIGSWTQGVAKLAQALMGGYNVRKTNQQEQAGRAAGAADTAAALAEIAAMGGGTADLSGTEAVSGEPTGDVTAYLGSTGRAGGIGSDRAASLPAGMRNNNPGNIKYTSRTAFPGVVGPSRNTDQGDPQAVFATPEAGMAAAASLLRRKFNGGKRTVDQIIAGNMGWTPGNHAAAANIARTMGVGPHDQLNLNDPSQMQRFMRGLLLQEHGPKSQMYDDAMIGRAVGGGGETAALPNVQPVGSAPSPDVAAFLGQGTQANPRVVYPPPESPPQVVPNVGQGAATGSGTRPSIPGGPAAMMTPAPIGRGAVAGPVPGTPMPTRPTVTGFPNVSGAPGPALPSNDPLVQALAVSPPFAQVPVTGPEATPPPILQGGHTLMAQPPPAPMGKGMSIGPYGGQIADAVAPPAALAAVPPPQQDPRTRAIQAVVQAQGRTDVPPIAPPAPIIGRTPPVARTPQPRPAPGPIAAAPAAAAPAATGSVAAQPRRQIFRESGAPLSAQEFARQGQNYLTGRGSFADQTPRVAPRTMQEPVAGGAPGAPAVAAAPAQPRRGLLAALTGRGGPQAPAAAQAAPAGSPVAATPVSGATAPAAASAASSALSRVMANPYVSDSIKAALLARALPKPPQYGFVTMPDGTLVRTNPDAGTASPTGITGGKTTHVLSPDERAGYGIKPDDPAVYQVDNTGKVDKVGGAGVNVNVGGPETGAAKLRGMLGTKEGERLSALKEAGQTAANMRQDIEALDALIKLAPQGPITGALAEAFPGFSNAGAAFQSIVKRVAPTLRVPGSGSTSDVEYQGMLDSMPALKNRPEANAAIAGMMKAKAEINVQRRDVLDQFEDGAITDVEMRSQLRAIDRQSIMTPELRQLFAGLDTTPAGAAVAKPTSKTEYDALPSGVLFIAPDGTQRRKP